jgi:hypothetical protein
MSDSAIQAAAQPLPTAPPEPVQTRPRRDAQGGIWYWLRKAVVVAASLRITVVLFLLAILLIFFGTLAQVDAGIWTVVTKYFRCFFAWIPFKIFFFRGVRDRIHGGFPFPGGWLIAGLLLVNLLAAHAIRFRLTWKRSGVLILHAGLIVMIAGEFITGLFAVESRMGINTGKTSNYLYSHQYVELAFSTRTKDGEERIVAIPNGILKKQGTVNNESLPFIVHVDKFMVNSKLSPPGSDLDNPATAGAGLNRIAIERPEGSGVDEGDVDHAAAYVTLVDRKTGKASTYLFAEQFGSTEPSEFGLPPQQISVDDRVFEGELRFARTYEPFTVKLHDVTAQYYPGTETPRSFVSRIHMTDPEEGVERDETISMNAPLRYRGYTFYQANVNMDWTGLQVVRNPGAPMPYLSCGLVAVGMLVHFGIQLIEFLRRRAAA